MVALCLGGSALAQGKAEQFKALIAQARATQPSEPAQARALFQQAAGFLDPANPAHHKNLAYLLNEIGVLSRQIGAPAEAAEQAAQAVALARGGDPAALTVYLTNLGLARHEAGQLDGAAESLAEALALARGPGPARPDQVARIAVALSAVLLAYGDEDAAFDTVAALDTGGLQPPDQLAVLLARAEAAVIRRRTDAAAAALEAAAPLAAGAGVAQALRLKLLRARNLMNLAQSEPARSDLTEVRAAAEAAGLPALAVSAQYNLAEIAFTRGDFVEAERLNRGTEEMYLALYGTDHVSVAQTMHRRALIHQEIGDLDTALTLYDAARAVFERTVGTAHPLWFSNQIERTRVLTRLGRHDEALAVLDALPGPDASRVEADSYNRLLAQAALGIALFEMDKPALAQPILEQVQAIRAARDFPVVNEPEVLAALTEIYLGAGDLDRAAAVNARALDILTDAQADSIDKLGRAQSLAAAIALGRGENTAARRLVRANLARIGRQLSNLALNPSYAAEFTPWEQRAQVGQALDVLWAQSDGRPDAATAEEMFQAAQLLHLNETTRATNGFMQRLGSDDPRTAALLAERRRLTQDLREAQQRIATFYGQEAVHADERAALIARTNRLEDARRLLDRQMEQSAPELMALLAPRPVGGAEIAAALRADELFWMQATFEGHSYLFLLSQAGLTVRRSDLGAQALTGHVDALRYSVDVTTADFLREFDHGAAAALYDGLFGPFAAQIDAAQRLVVVPDLAAQQIALSVLSRPTAAFGPEFGAGHPTLRFFGLTHALAVAPSPTSFLRLRNAATISLGDAGFIGFGDPALHGQPGAQSRSLRSAVDPSTRLANPAVIAEAFEPLEETAEELRSMSQSVSGAQTRIYLRTDATERKAKTLDYGSSAIVAFATHAIVSGDFDHLLEPALILTPPDAPTVEDDGLLTASEIARLRIDADLVVLSACNTGATSGRTGAPGLSGLASGFFMAGARSVVVSHWTIFSLTSLLIMPPFFDAATGADRTDPAEALRRSMLSVANDSRSPYLAHPAVWAPFVVVGDR
ncbi:MAG: CHAT domain-containing protein [Roseivivax sp.]|nr:CHAT domain-containing protein [Roseivivax sp.]